VQNEKGRMDKSDFIKWFNEHVPLPDGVFLTSDDIDRNERDTEGRFVIRRGESTYVMKWEQHVEPSKPWPRPRRHVYCINVGEMSQEDAEKELERVRRESGFAPYKPYRWPWYVKALCVLAILSGIFLVVVHAATYNVRVEGLRHCG
jgi:hypothetical protein